MATSDKAAAKARVAAARAALDQDIDTLTTRVPGGAQLAKGGAAGGVGLTALSVGAKVLQKKMSERSKENALTKEASIQAKAIAAAMAAHMEAQRAAAPAPAPVVVTAPTPSIAQTVADTASEAISAATSIGDSVGSALATVDDDSGTPWGIILLLVALIGTVVAIVSRGGDDEDLWVTPGA